jgi:hypothetical protein
VEDVDTGPPAAAATTAETAPAKQRRFNLDRDALGPEQVIREEKGEPFTIDFGDPVSTEWFRVDPRLGHSATVTFVKVIPPEATRPRLFYVPIEARGIPELSGRLRLYTLHAIQKCTGKAVRCALWPRRQPTTFRGGDQDAWGATDAKVAERAKQGWIRREQDPNATQGWHAVPPQLIPGEEPMPTPPFDDRPLEDLMELGIQEAEIIRDDKHPLIQYLRHGKV